METSPLTKLIALLSEMLYHRCILNLDSPEDYRNTRIGKTLYIVSKIVLNPKMLFNEYIV